MHSDDVAVVLQIRRARERSTGAALLRAQQMVLRATAQRGDSERAVAAFALQRQAREAAVSRTLTAGPISAHQLRMAAAELAGIAAHAESLRQTVTRAVREEAACVTDARTAQTGFAAATRAALGVSALHERVDAAARRASVRKADSRIEDPAGIGRSIGALP
jgi:hypothetical protein